MKGDKLFLAPLVTWGVTWAALQRMFLSKLFLSYARFDCRSTQSDVSTSSLFRLMDRPSSQSNGGTKFRPRMRSGSGRTMRGIESI